MGARDSLAGRPRGEISLGGHPWCSGGHPQGGVGWDVGLAWFSSAFLMAVGRRKVSWVTLRLGFSFPNVERLQDAKTTKVGGTVNNFELCDNVAAVDPLVVGNLTVIKDGSFLGMAGDPLGEAHGCHADVSSRASSERACVSVHDIRPLQGILGRGRVFLHH